MKRDLSLLISTPLCFLLLHFQAFAQSADSLTPIVRKKWYQTETVKTVGVPALLIGYGISTIGNRGIYSSQDARSDLQKLYPGFQSRLDDYSQTAPVYAVYGLNLLGVRGKHNFVNRTLIYAISTTIMATTVGALKEATSMKRPNGSNYHSFPSRHTATAFCAATFLYEEYKHRSPWYGVAGYGVATATGLMRMLNDQHWKSDVLVGAGIGILSAKVSYLIYPWIQRQIAKDLPTHTALAPFFDGRTGGFALVHVLE